jgi:hypothetical protein
MSTFRDAEEVSSLLVGGCFERLFASDDGPRVAGLASSLPVAPVLELRLTDPEAILSVDFATGTVVHAPAADASIQLEIEASVLHDILLERLSPVQISRPFEEDRAVIEGRPEALLGLVRVAGLLAKHYAASLVESGRRDLLELPAPPKGEVWQSDRPPKLVIGKRRPWQRDRVGSA